MGLGHHRTDGARVTEFTIGQKYFLQDGGPNYRATDRILGFVSQGKSSRRWLKDGIPPGVATLMAYIEEFGRDVAEELALKRDAIIEKGAEAMPGKKWYIRPVKVDEFRVQPKDIFRSREKLKLSQPMFDRMFGSTSRGRACRLWEEKGAPPYVEFFLAYAEKYGAQFAFDQVEGRGQRIAKKALGPA